MDGETALALFGSTQLAVKILGPTAEYLGSGIRTWTEERVKNVRSIFANAAWKLGDRVDEHGSVPARVLAGILGDGSYCDDPVATDYLGGVLASSRTGFARDDRAGALVALISRLSTYEIRAHYVLYTAARQRLRDITLDLRGATGRRVEGRMFVPWTVFDIGMDWAEGEPIDDIVPHVLYGLSQEQLIGEEWAAGSPEALGDGMMMHAPAPGIAFEVSIPGIELFLWAHGRPGAKVEPYLDPSEDFQLQVPLEVPSGSLSLKELRSASRPPRDSES